ncbi:MAG: hypothetical protein U9O78_03095, partial [Patescibacteria group bacterium]|nr:hypothetical protein [Patescibacteria group bacterium]
MKSSNDFKNIRTALVYDRVNTRYGGAEQILTAFFELFPQADLYTSVFDQEQAKWVKPHRVKPSFLQKLPLAKSRHRAFLPLMPFAFENLNLSDYDLVISVTSAEAKGVITKPEQLHLCYLLSPPRYLYSHRQRYLQSRLILKIPPFAFVAKKILDYLTWWDQVAIYRPDVVIPLSK